MKPKLKKVFSQPSWLLANDKVELAITELGGHLAPVTFFPGQANSIQPYWIAPWHKNPPKLPAAAGVLVPLRGDFFCMPFGANLDPHKGQTHPVHGEVSAKKWKFKELCDDGKIAKLTLEMKTRSAKGKVVKDTYIKKGQSVVYQSHDLIGYSGKMPIGNHHTLDMPLDKPESVLVGSSAIEFGMTNPSSGDPASFDYAYTAAGEKFKSITKVPTKFKSPATCDCSKFPTRPGFGEILQIYHKQQKDTPAWMTATYTADGFMWYSLKRTDQFPATVFWIFNQNRWSAPWNVKSACLGLENSCSYFANGLADSAKANKISRAGIKTAIDLTPDKVERINVIQGVVRIPKGFGKANNAKFEKGKVTFISGKKKAVAKVDWEYLFTGQL